MPDFHQNTLYWFSAFAGSGLFLFQLVLSLIGLNPEHDTDFETHQFKWLTKQTLTGFFMFFGWTGLTCRLQFALSSVASAAFATLGGIVAVFVTGLLFQLAKNLHSPGTVFNIDEAIGKEAVVYQRIPKIGAGKITLSLHQHTYELDAISYTHEEIASFSPVQIIKKVDDKTLAVIPKGKNI